MAVGDKPKIAWLIWGDEDYGIRRGTLSLLGALQDGGYPIRVISMRPGPLASECRETGFDTVVLGLARTKHVVGLSPAARVVRRLTYFRHLRRFGGEVVRAVREARANLVHVRNSGLVLYAGAAARSAAIPCIWHMPNIVSDRRGGALTRVLFQVICRRYGVLPVGNSRYTAEQFGDLLVKPEVLYLGVDPDHFDPDRVDSSVRRDHGIPDDAVVLAVIARLTPVKAQDRLVEGLAQVGDPSVHLLMAGGANEPWYAAKVHELVRRLGIADRCHFVDRVNDPRPYYQAADVVVNSRLNAEPFGLSVIEGMMMKKPVLALAQGGPAETVLDGVTGWHIHTPSAAAYAAGLRRALGDRARWAEMGERGRTRAVENFSDDAFASRYAQLLARVVGQVPR